MKKVIFFLGIVFITMLNSCNQAPEQKTVPEDTDAMVE